jgi:AmiR/NasT family two-component response regulator
MAVQSPQKSLVALVVDEDLETLDRAARLVEAAGHRVVARETETAAVAQALERHGTDVAVVAIHDDPQHALGLIDVIAASPARCAVVMLLDFDDPRLIHLALDHGAHAYADRETLGALESAIDLACRRFGEVAGLARQVRHLEEGAARRALIDRAIGIVMERHGFDERAAYEMLRRRARSSRRPLAHVAQAVVDAHALF